MKIIVKLFATFREYLPMDAVNGAFAVDVEEKRTVQELLQTLNLPEEIPKVFLVNGRQTEDALELRAGDTVSIFPPLAGGRELPNRERCQPRRLPVDVKLAGG